MMKTLIALMAVLVATPALAQTPAPAATASSSVTMTGRAEVGAQVVDNDSNSAKFTEYRDLTDNFVLPLVTFSVNDASSGWFFDLRAANAGRNDQAIDFSTGKPGTYRFGVTWNETPHTYSNKALTPYIDKGNGYLALPATVRIPFKKLATVGGDEPGVLASDRLVAEYQAKYLAPTPLGTQTNHGRFSLALNATDDLTLSVAYDRREKTGSKSGFGPIGDRPPRTLNVQFAEPVDHLTNDVTFAAEHDGGAFQVRGEFLYSSFANGIDTVRWDNVWASGAPGADYDVWDRLVATVGARPLAPDNTYKNALVSGGINLAGDSRLSLSSSFGQFDQNQALLPYANHSGMANTTLPRQTAEGSIGTRSLNADYVINPWRRLNLRAYFRYYDLNNDTPADQWRYATSDATNLNGSVSFVNKRVSVAHAWDRNNAGLEGTFRLPARSALTLGYEHRAYNYSHREADTTENLLRAGLRLKPARWMSLDARYRLGLRRGTTYDNEVTHEGYWYSQTDGVDNNNPALTFDNHPDMRRFDVIDRQRQQVDVTLHLARKELLAVSAYVRYRADDFDAGVTPSQPLLGTGLAQQDAQSPGDQLGLLEDARTRYGADVFVQPSPRVSFNAFVSYDKGTQSQRGLEFNENNKANPSVIATAELGPWTRGSSQWTADVDDGTWSLGLGTSLQLVPNRVTLLADYTGSLADIDLTYAGYGVANWNGTPFPPTHQFAFSSPPRTTEDLHVVNLRLEIPVRMFTAILGYAYESYRLTDWQEGGYGSWVEAVGTDTLLRDSSRSYQWGNRLFNLGTYLAPSYNAHLGFVGLAYRF